MLEELVCKECGCAGELENDKWELRCGHHNSQLVTRELFYSCIKMEQRGAEDAMDAMMRSHGMFPKKQMSDAEFGEWLSDWGNN